MFATARFRSIDRSGCIESFWTIEGAEYRAKKEVVAGPFVNLYGFQIDYCTGTSGFDFNVGTDADYFKVRKNHTGASLRARIPVDISGTETDVAVNIVWTGIHLADRTIYIERVRQPGCESTAIARATVYDATARGTIIMDGTNLTPEPAFAAGYGESRFSGRGFLNGCDD
jgi:hypothetical protein